MLTEQRKMFVEELIRLRCKNQAQAAINAGYSEKTAHSQASNIMKDNEVAAYLEKRKSEIRQELQQEFAFDAVEARKIMYKIMKDKDARDIDKINIAKDFLDRAGYKAADKVELSGEIDANVIIIDDLK